MKTRSCGELGTKQQALPRLISRKYWQQCCALNELTIEWVFAIAGDSIILYWRLTSSNFL